MVDATGRITKGGLRSSHANSLFKRRAHAYVREQRRAIGIQTSAREPSTAFHLFCDFTLPRLASALAAHPPKRREILRGFYSFVGGGVYSRVQVNRGFNTMNSSTAPVNSCSAPSGIL